MVVIVQERIIKEYIATYTASGIAKGGPRWICACPTYINCLPKCLICTVNGIKKDQYTLIKQSNTLLKHSEVQLCLSNYFNLAMPLQQKSFIGYHKCINTTTNFSIRIQNNPNISHRWIRMHTYSDFINVYNLSTQIYSTYSDSGSNRSSNTSDTGHSPARNRLTNKPT